MCEKVFLGTHSIFQNGFGTQFQINGEKRNFGTVYYLNITQ